MLELLDQFQKVRVEVNARIVVIAPPSVRMDPNDNTLSIFESEDGTSTHPRTRLTRVIYYLQSAEQLPLSLRLLLTFTFYTFVHAILCRMETALKLASLHLRLLKIDKPLKFLTRVTHNHHPKLLVQILMTETTYSQTLTFTLILLLLLRFILCSQGNQRDLVFRRHNLHLKST